MELNIYITEASNNYHVKRHKSLYILFIKKLEGLQPSGLYIHEQMYISFPSSLVPSSPGTAYHQKYVRPVPSASSRQG
jgi:hypothetical protein